MEIFHKNGHLTNTALSALVRQDALAPLTRLEISEHLAFCDICLQRYTELLAGTELLTPEHSCQESLWKRLRARTFHLFTSRYATAAAAVALALTLLWGGSPSKLQPVWEKAEGVLTETVQNWPERWDSALEQFSHSLDGFLDPIRSLGQNSKGAQAP